MDHPLTRAELIDLVERIMAAHGSEEELDRMLERFAAAVPHPSASDLIYYPTQASPTAAQIVDQAMSYRPIQL